MDLKKLISEIDAPVKPGTVKVSPSGKRKTGSPQNYLGLRRMEKSRMQLQTVLGNIDQIIPARDHGLLVSASEQGVLNNGLLKGILEDKATGVVGDAFTPEFTGNDSTWAETHALPYLETWQHACEQRGILSFSDIQFQKSTNMDASGDVFRLLTRRKNGEASIQIIRAHRIGQRGIGDLVTAGEYAGHRIEKGIIMDPDTDEVVAYQLLGDTPAGDRIIPKGPMCHLIDPIFSDQVRGLPAAVAGLRALVMTGKIDEQDEDFMEMVSRIFFIEKNPTGEAAPDFGGGDGDTDGEPTGPRTVDLWSGLAKIFQSGTDSGLEAFNPGDRPSEAFDRALDRRYRIICAGIGWPYELAWKLGELTSVGVHSVEQKARRTIRDRQGKIMPSAVQELRWAIACAMDAGLIPFSPDWDKWGVTLPPAYSLNPTKAAESRRRDLELGLTTVGRVLKEEGTPGGAAALFRERAREVASKKTIRDEVAKESGQTIEDWEMGRPPQGMAVTVSPTNTDEK